jgi:hypothetical protein
VALKAATLSSVAEKDAQPDTASPARNFTLSLDERLRAYAQGVPGYIRRRRRIEDLEARLVAALAATPDGASSTKFSADLAQLNDLIAKHNRYYPIEANLPIDIKTGHLIERGARWRPLPAITVASLLATRR